MGIFDLFKKHSPSKEGYHFIVMEDREPEPKPVFETVESNTLKHGILGTYVRKLYRSGGNSKHYSATVSDKTLQRYAGKDYTLDPNCDHPGGWKGIVLQRPSATDDWAVKIRNRKNSNSVALHFNLGVFQNDKPYIKICVDEISSAVTAVTFNTFRTREEAEDAD